jgi:hypothetical protein
MKTHPNNKTCHDCKGFDMCSLTGRITAKTRFCMFPVSQFTEGIKETVYITLLLNRAKRKAFLSFAEQFGMVDYVSHDGKSFGLLCTFEGANILKKGLQSSEYYRGLREIIVNAKPQLSIIMTSKSQPK